MRELNIDEKSFSSIKEVHEALAEGLGFPAYYGRNLSALWDCLGDLDEPVRVVLRPASEEAFLDEVDSVLRVLARAAHHGMIDLVVASGDDWRSDPDSGGACDDAADATPCDGMACDDACDEGAPSDDAPSDYDDFSDVSD